MVDDRRVDPRSRIGKPFIGAGADKDAHGPAWCSLINLSYQNASPLALRHRRD